MINLTTSSDKILVPFLAKHLSFKRGKSIRFIQICYQTNFNYLEDPF
ncbi:MAG: hypothetical protein ACTS68_01125 [Candidatus Hodgkinia cicadicola]